MKGFFAKFEDEITKINFSSMFFAKLSLFTLIYFVSAQLGLQFETFSKLASLIWPTSGIALAILLLFGRRYWPAVFIGATLVNYHHGAPFVSAFIIGIGNTLEALVGAYLLRPSKDFHRSIDRLKDVLSFTLYACISACTIAATIGTASLWAYGNTGEDGVLLTWLAWWGGDFMGCLIVAPLILLWATSSKKIILKGKYFEALILVTSLLVVSYLNFKLSEPRLFWFFPFIIWSSLRFGQLGSVTLSFFIACITVYGTTKGFGPFDIRTDIFLHHCFLFVLSITGMILSSVLAERKLALGAMQSALKIRDEFLAMAGHELRTPLTSVKLHLQLIQSRMENEAECTPEKLKDSIKKSNLQVDRLTKLMDNLLDASLIQTGRFNYQFAALDLTNLVHNVFSKHLHELKLANCQLELQLEEKITLQGDELRLEQVIDNLISNILKYAKGANVKSQLFKKAHEVHLIVEDFGEGIPAHKQTRIFERFERAHDPRTTVGLGLGLYIVREIVEGHKGRISLQKTASGGARFEIILPA